MDLHLVQELAARKKTETSEIDAQNRNVPAVEEARTTKKSPISTEGDKRVQLCWILESSALARYLMQTLLEQWLDSERRRDAEKRAEYFRKLVITLMPDDTKPHQTARRWVPRELSIPNASLTRRAMPCASRPRPASCFARGA